MIEVDLITFRYGRIIADFRRNRHFFPLFEFNQALAKRGVFIHFYTLSNLPKSSKSDVLCLDSRVFSYNSNGLCNEHLEKLSIWRQRYERIVWFDNRDSSGNTQFETLPYVDRYCKKQLLRNLHHYQTDLYGGRLYTDYLHKRLGLEESKPERLETPLDPIYQDKLNLSWNLAYTDYRNNGLWRYLTLFWGSRKPVIHNVNSNRPIDLHARFTASYPSEMVAYQRRILLEIAENLRDYEVRVGRTSLQQYQQELRQAKAVLSPFGWGEICYRDFEAMINGCALVKPDMAHIQTYPDIFQDGETYISLPWEFNQVSNKLYDVLNDKQLLHHVATTANRRFRELWTSTGVEEFCHHFSSLINP